MKIDLPSWAQSPFVVGPFIAGCIAIPLLLAISDRAAAFAGSLFASLAAVVAVLLTGEVQRRNERARERRAYAGQMERDARELRFILTTIANASRSLLPEMRKMLRDGTLNRNVQAMDAASWRRGVLHAYADIPPRIAQNTFAMTDDVMSSVTAYIAQRNVLEKKYAINGTGYLAGGLPLNETYAKEIIAECTTADTMLAKALTALDAYRADLKRLAET